MAYYHLTALDPGGRTGWVHFVVDFRAFSRPENKVLRWLTEWESGEVFGSQRIQVRQIVALMNVIIVLPSPPHSKYDVVSEDFIATQTVGGRSLLIPAELNAQFAHECDIHGIPFHLQLPSMRVNMTKARVRQCGFTQRFGKDEFAAIQHGLVWLRRIKAASITQPWQLPSKDPPGEYWDCACANRKPCDLLHP